MPDALLKFSWRRKNAWKGVDVIEDCTIFENESEKNFAWPFLVGGFISTWNMLFHAPKTQFELEFNQFAAFNQEVCRRSGGIFATMFQWNFNGNSFKLNYNLELFFFLLEICFSCSTFDSLFRFDFSHFLLIILILSRFF